MEWMFMETITYKNELLAKTTESANLMEGERLFQFGC